MKKYFKLYRKEENLDLFFNYMNRISIDSIEKRNKIEKRNEKDLKNYKLELFLVEVTKNIDFTESITNIWLLPIGTSSIWLKYIKENVMYDCTGIILIVHKGNKVFLWEDYMEHLSYN
jgi:hypothetical protein